MRLCNGMTFIDCNNNALRRVPAFDYSRYFEVIG